MPEPFSTVVQIFIEPKDFSKFEKIMDGCDVPYYVAGEWGQYTTLEEIECELENK